MVAVLALLAALVCVGLVPASARSASVAAPVDDGRAVQISLDAVSPSVATPGESVRITGSLVNIGDEAVSVQQIRARTAYRGLDTRARVSAWADQANAVPTPRELGVDTVNGQVQPGAMVSFIIVVAPDAVAPPFDVATLPLLLDVSGPDGTVHGVLRTFLPWDSRPEAQRRPIALSMLVPLTLPADPELGSADDAVRAAAWTRGVGSGSQVDRLLDGLGGYPTTFLVDPALLAPPDPAPSLAPDPLPAEPQPEPEPPAPTTAPTTPAPTSGDDVQATAPDGSASTTGADEDSSTGTATSGTVPPSSTPASTPTDSPGVQQPEEPDATPGLAGDQAVAQSLGDRLDNLPDDQVWWLPTHDVDTEAMARLGQSEETVAERVGIELTAEPSASPSRRTVAWPVLQAADDLVVPRLVSVWDRAGLGPLRALVVPDSAVQGGDAFTGPGVWRTADDGPLLLSYEESLSGLVVNAGNPGRDGLAIQRLLADTLAIYQERPSVQRSLVLALPRSADLSTRTLSDVGRALESAAWVSPVTAEELLAVQAVPTARTP